MTCRFTGTKDPNYLYIAELSDIHLGHPNTKTDEITHTLIDAFPSNPETSSLDMIILAGDVFDRLVQLPNALIVSEIEIWIIDLLKLCVKHDIVLRVLEGTPSHDRKQGYLFNHLNVLYGIGADVEYHKRLAVVWEEKFSCSVLYIPDEWSTDHHKTYTDAVQAIHAAGLTQVDFAVMHGAFDYQLPAYLGIPTHDSRLYLDLVKEYIFVGHIHIHSIHDRIISAGSFNRLAFGEEAAKGHVRVKVRGKGKDHDTIKFIKTRNAKRYDTYDVKGMDINQVIALLDNLGLPQGSFIRLLCTKADPVFFSEKALQASYDRYKISVVQPDEKRKTESTTDDPLALKPKAKFVPIDINPSNAKRLMADRLLAANLKTSDVDRIVNLLDGLL